MLKKCKNTDCKNNKDGICKKNNVNSRLNDYDILTDEQWISLRKKQEQRKKTGAKPKKYCKNEDCINNIEKGCYLPSEVMVLAEITDEQWDELMTI